MRDLSYGIAVPLRVITLALSSGLAWVLIAPAPVSGAGDPCSGRRVFVVDLPAEFNTGLACNATESLWANAGMGPEIPEMARPGFLGEAMQLVRFDLGKGLGRGAVERRGQEQQERERIRDETLHRARERAAKLAWPVLPRSWFFTDHLSLEVILLHRMRSYQCRTKVAASADAVYVPIMTQPDIAKQLAERRGQGGHLSSALVEKLCPALESQAAWRDTSPNGSHAFTVAGSTGWNLLKPWGPGLRAAPCLRKGVMVSVENNVWLRQSLSVPYPTIFHPPDEAALTTWIKFVQTTHAGRPFLVSLIGSMTAGHPIAHKLRETLHWQCVTSPKCLVVMAHRGKAVHLNVAPALATYLSSVFCLQPRGASCTLRDVMDSILAGCIPVVFENCSLRHQWQWHLRTERRKPFFVQIPMERLKRPPGMPRDLPPCLNPHSTTTAPWPREQVGMGHDCMEEGLPEIPEEEETLLIDEYLGAIPAEEVRYLQSQGIWVISRITYGGHLSGDGELLPLGFRDAFDLLVEAVVNKLNGQLQGNVAAPTDAREVATKAAPVVPLEGSKPNDMSMQVQLPLHEDVSMQELGALPSGAAAAPSPATLSIQAKVIGFGVFLATAPCLAFLLPLSLARFVRRSKKTFKRGR